MQKKGEWRRNSSHPSIPYIIPYMYRKEKTPLQELVFVLEFVLRGARVTSNATLSLALSASPEISPEITKAADQKRESTPLRSPVSLLPIFCSAHFFLRLFLWIKSQTNLRRLWEKGLQKKWSSPQS